MKALTLPRLRTGLPRLRRRFCRRALTLSRTQPRDDDEAGWQHALEPLALSRPPQPSVDRDVGRTDAKRRAGVFLRAVTSARRCGDADAEAFQPTRASGLMFRCEIDTGINRYRNGLCGCRMRPINGRQIGTIGISLHLDGHHEKRGSSRGLSRIPLRRRRHDGHDRDGSTGAGSWELRAPRELTASHFRSIV